MSAQAEGYRDAGFRPASPSLHPERLLVVRRDRFEAFAVLRRDPNDFSGYQLPPEFGANLTIARFGSFGTGR